MIAPSGPGSDGSGRVSTRIWPGLSITTVRMVSSVHHEICGVRTAGPRPVVDEAPRAQTVHHPVLVLVETVLDGWLRPDQRLQFGLAPLIPVVVTVLPRFHPALVGRDQ